MRWVLLAWMLTLLPAPVAVSVSPQVVMAGGIIYITCRVLRDAANRGLDIALVPVQSTYRQLDGDDARVTTTLAFPHVPCWAEAAACQLHAQGEADITVSRRITVAGCGQ
jgi:hypothetical protein